MNRREFITLLGGAAVAEASEMVMSKQWLRRLHTALVALALALVPLCADRCEPFRRRPYHLRDVRHVWPSCGGMAAACGVAVLPRLLMGRSDGLFPGPPLPVLSRPCRCARQPRGHSALIFVADDVGGINPSSPAAKIYSKAAVTAATR